MKRTSFFSRLVRIAARSFGFSSTGPEVERRLTPSSRGNDVRERRLAEAGRAEQQHVVHRLAAPLRSADEDRELLARLRLADVFGEPLRSQCALDRLFVGRGGDAAHDASSKLALSAIGGPAANSSVWMLMAHYRTSACRACADNPPVPFRFRFASRLTLWVFAAALVPKSAVAMPAALSAGGQGEAAAEICDVYGVATASIGGQGSGAMVAQAAAPMAHVHGHVHGDAHGHAHGGAPPAASSPAHDDPAPGHRHGAQSGDHCVLTGFVAIAASDAPILAGLVADGATRVVLPRAAGVVVDAAARWAALLGHGPPAFS